VLITAESGQEKDLLDRILLADRVKEAHITYGIYDIIVLVEAETQGELERTIKFGIRTLKGVKTTLTAVVVE
jgi:DNA-binding Lrp family transcriptional regulator